MSVSRARIVVGCFVLAGWAVAGAADAQQLRFTLGHTEIGQPDFATFRVGPLYSHLTFSQEVGVRYTEGTLDVVDYLSSVQRGAYRADGIDFPLITRLSLRNYLLISKYMDVDITLSARNEHYPFKTQDDMFYMNLNDPEFLADVATSFTWELFPARFAKVKVFDHPAYLLDYVDQRGTSDPYGGVRYSRFENTAGIDADMLLRSDMSMGLSFGRYDVRKVSDAFADREQTAYSGGAMYEYEMTPTFVAGAKLGYRDVDYLSATRGDFVSQDLMVFGNAEFSESTTASAGIGCGRGISSATNAMAERVEVDGALGSFSLRTEIWKDLVFKATYTRAIRAGFNDPVETADTLEGKLSWTDEVVSLGLSSAVDSVDVAAVDATDYRDWRSSFEFSCLLATDLTVGYSSSYIVRAVKVPAAFDTAGLASELVNNYSTWINSVRCSLELMENLTAGAYADYVLRDSAADGLKYHRFNIGANLIYSFEY